MARLFLSVISEASVAESKLPLELRSVTTLERPAGIGPFLLIHSFHARRRPVNSASVVIHLARC